MRAKRLGLVAGSALVSINIWTGAPLVWFFFFAGSSLPSN